MVHYIDILWPGVKLLRITSGSKTLTFDLAAGDKEKDSEAVSAMCRC